MWKYAKQAKIMFLIDHSNGAMNDVKMLKVLKLWKNIHM